ncbi:MAG TPA: ribose 5-phosphate isomerase B [Terriglobia bacterium]|nr:ribose 5-phosphate isomerase B [Terriglobia bacterium]
MRIAIGADHAGFTMKEELAAEIRKLGHDLLDVGALHADPSDDYPDFAEAVGKALMEGKAERGVLICGSGVGVSVAANKMPGIRAAVCHDAYSAHQGVEHDNMNVLVLGSRIIGPELARELVKTYLGARFSGEERHCRRLAKVDDLEHRYLASRSVASK